MISQPQDVFSQGHSLPLAGFRVPKGGRERDQGTKVRVSGEGSLVAAVSFRVLARFSLDLAVSPPRFLDISERVPGSGAPGVWRGF